MKKRFWLKIMFFLAVVCSLACQPGGGDFVPLPLKETTVESYNDKKDVVQVYTDEQILLKVRGQWEVENGASSFFVEVTNKSQKDLAIEPDALNFNTNLDEKITAAEISHTVTGNLPTETAGNQKLKEAKLEDGKIKIKSGQKAELDTGFYLNTKGLSKTKSYFLGKEVRFSIPVKFEAEEKIYTFAFKFDNYR